MLSSSLLSLTSFATFVFVLAFSSILADYTHEISGETMGTTYRIKWIEDVDAEFKLKQLVDDRLDEINRLMSTYDSDSELSKFNAYQKSDWFPVSKETATVVQAALDISELSGGAFDPTVGRLVRLWNFGSGPHIDAAPPEAVIDEALKSVGHQLIKVRENPPALSKSNPMAELDLSAIAKGYGVDATIQLLAEQKILNCMVEIGGEVRVSGTKNGVPWKLGIERPESLAQSLHATVDLTDAALATSGDYRNHFEDKGIRYSHTINPQTGKPVTHQLASASVIAADCMTADAWATTLMVLGPEEGLQLADTHEVTAYLLERNGKDFRELSSKTVLGQFVNLTQVEAQGDPAMSPLLSTFLLSLAVFGVAIIGLAAGVILSNKTLKGSCGGADGLKDKDGKSACDLCTTPPEECDQFKEKLRGQIENAK